MCDNDSYLCYNVITEICKNGKEICNGTGYDKRKPFSGSDHVYTASCNWKYFPAALQHGRYHHCGALCGCGCACSSRINGNRDVLLNGFAQGITAGFAVLTSQRYGAKKMDGVRQSVSNGILLSLIGAIGFTAASLLFMRPLLHLMNTPENIFAQAYEYISLISLGMVANVFYNLFSSYLRAVGNSRMPLVFWCCRPV